MASSHGARPVLLKDFLRDDQHSSDDDDFLSFPRRSDTTVRKLLEIDLSAGDLNNVRRLRRSRSKAAASTAISAFQKASEAVINAVKLLPFSSVKSPSSSRPKQKLRRSFWKNNEREVREIRGRVRVRDIVRWRSFGDEEGKNQNKKPLDFAFPSSTNTNTITTTTTSSRSSWSESDFTSDFVRSSSGSSVYSAENERYDGKKHSAEKSRSPKRGGVGEDSMETATCYGERKGADGEGGSGSPYEEKEQLSPVSVLDFPCEDEETSSSSSSTSFQQSLANMERTKQQLLQKIRRFECLAELDPVDLEKRIAQSELEDDDDDNEEVEEEDKLMDLLKHFKASYGESQKTNIDRFLIDFFREGLSMQEREDDEVEKELLRAASNWMNGLGAIIWGVQDTREEHLKEMERGGRWRKFDEGKGELVVELEVGVLSSLVEELMLDLLS